MTKIALVHEWLDSTGGSENVFLEMATIYPDADLWCLWNNLLPRADGRPVHESLLARTPLKGRKAAALSVMPLAWRSLPTRTHYDTVVTSSHCLAHSARFRSSPDARHLSYVYSPMRYVWSPELDVRGDLPSVLRQPFKVIDRSLTRHLDGVAAISHEVRKRVEKYWDREATVIYPPVDTDFYQATTAQELPFDDFLLAVGRWIPYKRFDLIIEVAEATGVPLVICGSGPEESRLAAQATACRVNVVFEHRPTRHRLRELYTAARAFLFPVHEDFGLVPLEAMACGTPVVGLARGGLLETVEHGTSGWLAQEPTVAALAEGVREVATYNSTTTAELAMRFSRQVFAEAFTSWVGSAPGSQG